MTNDLALRDPEWTEEDLQVLELLLERAALELASRNVMGTIWSDLASQRGHDNDASGLE